MNTVVRLVSEFGLCDVMQIKPCIGVSKIREVSHIAKDSRRLVLQGEIPQSSHHQPETR